MLAEAGFFCPCMCLHECRLSSSQQIVYNPSAFLEKLIYDYHCWLLLFFVILDFFFFQVSLMHRIFFFYFHLNYMWIAWKWGDKSDENTHKEQKTKFWRDFFYWNVKLLTRFGTKVGSCLWRSFPNWQKNLTSPVFVVFELVSSNYFKTKAWALKYFVRGTILAVAHFLIKNLFIAKVRVGL